MALPALPALNSVDWYAWASAIHDAVEATSLDVKRIVYSGSSYPTRPLLTIVPAGYAEYVGPTEPTDWVTGDTWIQAA